MEYLTDKEDMKKRTISSITEVDIAIDLKIKKILTKAEIISSISLFVGIIVIILLSGVQNIYQTSLLTHNLISLFSGIVIWGINAVNIAWAYNKIKDRLLERYIARATDEIMKELGIKIGEVKDDYNNEWQRGSREDL